MQSNFGVSKATISLLFLAGSAGYLLAAFGNGLLLERFGYRRLQTAGAAVFLCGTAILATSPPFVLALPSFLLLGFAVAIVDAGLNAYIASLPDNAALLNYLHAFYGVGALVGPLVASGALASGFTWNSVYVAWSAMSLLLLVGAATLFAGRDETVRAAPETSAGGPKRNVMSASLRLRVVWLASVFLLLYVGTEVSMGNWSYSYLTEQRGQAALLSGWIVSGYWLGLTLGRFLLGKLAARVGIQRLISGCMAGVTAGVLVAWLVPGGLAPAIGLWLAGFCLGPVFPTTIAYMSQVVPARLLPGSIGFAAAAGSMGAALFPWLAGNLAEQAGLWAIMPFVVVLAGLTLLLWLALQRSPRPIEDL